MLSEVKNDPKIMMGVMIYLELRRALHEGQPVTNQFLSSLTTCYHDIKSETMSTVQ